MISRYWQSFFVPVSKSTQITPFVFELSFIVAEFDELAKREVSQEVLDIVVTLMFYVAWEFTFP